MRRRSARLATFFRSRTRQLVWAGSLAVLGAALLEGAYETADFTRDLLVNLGVGVVMVGLTFVVFDPIFEDMRRNAVQEHRDLNHDQLVADIAAARGEVDVPETWTGLLEDRHRDRFLAGTVAALGRGVHFRLLLLDPESQAAEQRADELHLPGLAAGAARPGRVSPPLRPDRGVPYGRGRRPFRRRSRQLDRIPARAAAGVAGRGRLRDPRAGVRRDRAGRQRSSGMTCLAKNSKKPSWSGPTCWM